MSAIEAFLQEVDRAWRQPGPRIRLRIIGSTALMLQTSYDRGTKDSDVLETDELTDRIATRLIEIAGPDTVIHKRHGLYVDIVQRGVPFRRQSPVYLQLEQLNASLRHFEVSAMSVVDVVEPIFSMTPPRRAVSPGSLRGAASFLNRFLLRRVGEAGFEPATTSTQSSCTTGLCDSPWRLEPIFSMTPPRRAVSPGSLRGAASALDPARRGALSPEPARNHANISSLLRDFRLRRYPHPGKNADAAEFRPGRVAPRVPSRLDMALGPPWRYAGNGWLEPTQAQTFDEYSPSPPSP